MSKKSQELGEIHSRLVMADTLTPVTAFLRVARGRERAFLLESVEGSGRISRYSFIGVDPERFFQGSFADFRATFPRAQEPDPDLPPFAGGAVGLFGYEMARELERLPERGKPAAADGTAAPVRMDFYSTILAFDHVRQQVTILSRQGPERLRELEARLLDPEGDGSDQAGPVREVEGDGFESLGVEALFSDADFAAAVERARSYIRAGDILQVVLSRRFACDFSGDPFRVYRALRFINPSPYMFFLKQGETTIAGASPEMLVRVEGEELSYRPIAGTRPRGPDARRERELEAELRSDEKERAEHLMLVDLGRNDLGRVSRYGSVEVARLMSVEKYSHVMHLVSSLRGRLRPDLDRFDALEACFPAGTVTGAPKIRAMEVIEELEPERRGAYAGAIGYLDYSGNLDTCIAIRSIVFHGGRAHLQAGAGIVADSVPEREIEECRDKAGALVKALAMGADGG